MSRKFDWTAEFLALLGTDIDAAVARQLGLHKSTVTNKRNSLGIARYDSYKNMPIGQLSDAAIARKKGVSITAVARQRYRKGIAASQKQTKWTDAHVALLGTASDVEVGRVVGRDKMAVYFARRSRGIPAYNGKRRSL